MCGNEPGIEKMIKDSRSCQQHARAKFRVSLSTPLSQVGLGAGTVVLRAPWPPLVGPLPRTHF